MTIFNIDESDRMAYEIYQLTPAEIALVEQRLAAMPSATKAK